MASAVVYNAQRQSSPSPPPSALPGRNGMQYDNSQQPRLSLLSTTSAVSSSYRTAQDQRSSFTPSMSSRSSINTINAGTREREASPAAINPIHTMAKTKTQEIHIVKVTDDLVEIESGSMPQSYLERMGKSVLQTVQPDSHAGPPPPSPPASVEQEADDDEAPDRSWDPVDAESSSESLAQGHMDGPAAHPNLIAERLPAAPTTTATTRSGLTAAQLQRSSTDTKAPYSTLHAVMAPPVHISSQQHPPSASLFDASSSKANGHMSVDGYLQPPPLLASGSRPARRNTTGSTHLAAKLRPHGKGASQPYDDAAPAEGGMTLELESDIELQAERIRRERMSKRAKQQQEAEAALTRAAGDQTTQQDAPLVGNLIGEDHVNYVLMYNMLTGIRIGVRH